MLHTDNSGSFKGRSPLRFGWRDKRLRRGISVLRSKLIFLVFVSVILISLSACTDEKYPVIESSSVEIGSKLEPSNQDLHFLVLINGTGLEPEQEYNIRFVIKDSYIQDLIATDTIEIPETYKAMPGYAISTGSNIELTGEFKAAKIKKHVEKNQAVVVELYNGDRIIAQEAITTFADNRGKPLVTVTSEASIENIDLNDPQDIAIFSKAVSNSTREPGIVNIINPNYKFSLGDESYFLWLSEDDGSFVDGKIMNIKDTHTIYSLSPSSLVEVKEFIER